MKVLLTGGTGYIGSHVAVAVALAGHEVVLLDNLSNSNVEVVDQIEAILGRRPEFCEIDAGNTEAVAAAMRANGVEAVIHLAGLKAVADSVADPLAYYEGNVTVAIRLLTAMHEAGVRRLVFSSSATVYGKPQYLPFDEAHPTDPVNPYGRTKLHIEQMLGDLAAADPSFGALCLRYFNPVGAHESGLIGEHPRARPNNLVPYVARVAAGKLDRLKVFGADYDTPDGTGVRDYVHVMDVAEGHVAALDFLCSGSGWHAFNLGAGYGHSVLEVVHAFETASGCEVPYEVVARRAGDLPAYYADAGRARLMLGWQARRGLLEMCESAWNFECVQRRAIEALGTTIEKERA